MLKGCWIGRADVNPEATSRKAMDEPLRSIVALPECGTRCPNVRDLCRRAPATEPRTPTKLARRVSTFPTTSRVSSP
jgi:hypothetical protein